MNVVLRSCFVTVVLTSCSASFGQAIYYDHRSTWEGDVRSAMADQQFAWGAAARNWAEGYNFFMTGEERRLAIAYQVYEFRRLVEKEDRDALERKAEQRRRRNAKQMVDLDSAARRLVSEFQAGALQWPEALLRQEFGDSMGLIKGILTQWGLDRYGSDSVARRALATEVGVLRRRVAENRNITFISRAAAEKTLQLVQRVASMDSAIPSHEAALASLR